MGSNKEDFMEQGFIQ